LIVPSSWFGKGGCNARELRQMLHCVRNLRSKTVYLAFNKVGKETGLLPSLQQLAEEKQAKYLHGLQVDPRILSIPREWRQLHLYMEHERLWCWRRLKDEMF